MVSHYWASTVSTLKMEAIKEFEKIVTELYRARGLIIDLRYNGGGSTEVAWHLQKYLTKKTLLPELCLGNKNKRRGQESKRKLDR